MRDFSEQILTSTNIDECAKKQDNCKSLEDCFDTEGSFECKCKSGYENQSDTCVDVDECDLGSHNCSSKVPVQQKCVNIAGGYLCQDRVQVTLFVDFNNFDLKVV